MFCECVHFNCFQESERNTSIEITKKCIPIKHHPAPFAHSKNSLWCVTRTVEGVTVGVIELLGEGGIGEIFF